MYTKVCRPVMWLVRGDEAVLGGEEGQAEFSLELGSFYLSRGCVTNEQFEAFRPGFERHEQSSGDDHPAVGVCFRDAVAYAAWYAELAKKPFRLLTECEWEFAARAMGRKRYPWGDDPSGGVPYAWTRENSGGAPHAVDQVRPSKLGIYGMIGNVWEWTSSLHRPLPVEPDDGRDDLGVVGARVARGGGYDDPVSSLSCGHRLALEEEVSRADLGFRIARSL